MSGKSPELSHRSIGAKDRTVLYVYRSRPAPIGPGRCFNNNNYDNCQTQGRNYYNTMWDPRVCRGTTLETPETRNDLEREKIFNKLYEKSKKRSRTMFDTMTKEQLKKVHRERYYPLALRQKWRENLDYEKKEAELRAAQAAENERAKRPDPSKDTADSKLVLRDEDDKMDVEVGRSLLSLIDKDEKIETNMLLNDEKVRFNMLPLPHLAPSSDSEDETAAIFCPRKSELPQAPSNIPEKQVSKTTCVPSSQFLVFDNEVVHSLGHLVADATYQAVVELCQEEEIDEYHLGRRRFQEKLEYEVDKALHMSFREHMAEKELERIRGAYIKEIEIKEQAQVRTEVSLFSQNYVATVVGMALESFGKHGLLGHGGNNKFAPEEFVTWLNGEVENELHMKDLSSKYLDAIVMHTVKLRESEIALSQWKRNLRIETSNKSQNSSSLE